MIQNIKNIFRWRVIFGFLAVSIFLSACVWPEKHDPFERLPEEQLETLQGTIYPFSVSVSTRATHRLEKDNHLVSFLASNIIRLEDFEGRKVEVDGVRRTEKMREIFWVEAIRLEELPALEDIEPKEARFATKNFSFVHPSHWEYTQAPNGTLYFTDKNDVARRVFLTFSASELLSSDTNIETNILIANLAGTKEIITDETNRERQEIMLFSNTENTKYKFVFDSQFEDFEGKQAFFKLLNSFIEGEENVTKAVEDDKKKEAERQAKQLEILKARELVENSIKGGDEEEETIEEKSSQEQEDTKDSVGEESEVEEVIKEGPTVEEESDIIIGGDFKNLVDERAFYYESGHYRFSMKVPYGFWFRNFGPVDGSIAKIGFADHEITGPADTQFSLEIITGELPEEGEVLEDGILMIMAQRSDKTYYRLSGNGKWRDAMKSVQATLKTF